MRAIAFFGLMAASMASASSLSKLDLSGSLGLGGWSELSIKDGEYYPLNYANADFRLDGRFHLDQGVQLFAGLRSYTLDSTTGRPSGLGYGRAPVANLGDLGLGLHEFAAEWEFMSGLRMGLGRYAYSFGAISNEPLFANDQQAAALIKEHRINAVSLLADNMHVFIGIPDDHSRGLSLYGDFTFDWLKESKRTLSITPSVEINLWDNDGTPWTLGSAVDWSQKLNETWRYNVHGVGGVYGNPGNGSNSYSLLVQPVMDYASKLSFGLTLWNAFLASDDQEGLNITPMPVQRFVRGELSVPFLQRFSADLPLTWTDPLESVSGDDFYMLTPGLSIYANGNSEFRTWGGVRYGDRPWGNFTDDGLRGVFGLDAKINF